MPWPHRRRWMGVPMITDDYKIAPRLISPALLAQVASACEMADREGQREYYDHHAPIVVQCCNHLVRHVAALEVRLALLEAVAGAARALTDNLGEFGYLTDQPIMDRVDDALAALDGKGEW